MPIKFLPDATSPMMLIEANDSLEAAHLRLWVANMRHRGTVPRVATFEAGDEGYASVVLSCEPRPTIWLELKKETVKLWRRVFP